MHDQTEAQIRDLLAQQLDILETGLVLISKEAYLPNNIGTRSFVDLLAVDANNRYVLVEIKRNAKASREAIHEIHKYVEATKSHLGVREDEMRVFLVSTDWEELLVPFSRFVVDTSVSIKGFILRADEDRLTAESIEPLIISQGRVIAPWHDLCWYHNAESLSLGIKEHESVWRKKGIRDFVLVVLKSAPDFNERARASIISSYRDTMKPLGVIISDNEANEFVDKIGDYEYIIYSAVRILSRQEGIPLIIEEADRNEIEEYFDIAGEEDGIRYMHEMLSAMEPRPHHDRYEVGYATKLRAQLLEEQEWEIVELRRHGIFERNIALSDNAIIKELSALDGSTRQILTRTIEIADTAQLRSLIENVDVCLEDNPRWKLHLQRIFNEIRSQYPNSRIKTHIYNPCSGLVSVFLMATEGRLYMPAYYVHVLSEEQDRVYVGYIKFDPPALPFGEVLKKYYGGDIFRLLITLTWGGYVSEDTDILEDIGLTYRTAYIDNPKGERQTYLLREDRWYLGEDQNLTVGLDDFFQTEGDFVTTLVKEIGSRWNGGVIDASIRTKEQ